MSKPYLTGQSFEDRQLPLKNLTLPGPGVADLWLFDLQQLGNPMDPGTALDGLEMTSAQRRTLRRFYLRLLLGAYLGLPGKDVHVSRVVKGKPVLDAAKHDLNLDFSIAASGSCCLVGVTSGSLIGVDLEPKGRSAGAPLALARRYFSGDEYRDLQALKESDLDHGFLKTWSCKEALVKAAGHGIANRLCRFSVDVHPDRPAAVLAMDDDDPGAWQLRSLDAPGGHVGAVTVRYPELKMRGFRLLPPS